MVFHSLQKIRESWSKRRTTQRPGRPAFFRPSLEALEGRVLFALRVWTGDSPFSNHWSDPFNWKNPASFPSFTVGFGDSVFFPADAKQQDNVEDIDYNDLAHSRPPSIQLGLMQIEGGGYHISGNDIQLTSALISDGTNTIDNRLTFLSEEIRQSGLINVASGILNLRSDVHAEVGLDMVKTGLGTLKFDSSTIGEPDITGDFVAEEGLVALGEGAQMVDDLHIEAGTVDVLRGGDQISRDSHITIDPLGLLSFRGHSEGLGDITLNGGAIDTAGGTLFIEGTVSVTDTSEFSEISGTVDLGSSTRTFDVGDGPGLDDLQIVGRIQGAGGLIKTGNGRLLFGGDSANTYSGRTTVRLGVLALDKPDDVDAIFGGLDVGQSFSEVVLLNDEQISTHERTKIFSFGLLDLNGNLQTFDELSLVGGSATTGTGGLIIFGGGSLPTVAALAASRAATISGTIAIAGTCAFVVDNSVSGSDLIIDAVILSGRVQKQGTGTLELTANSPYAGDTINLEGPLVINGNLPNSILRVENGATVSGNGAVKSIFVDDGRLQPGDGIGTFSSNGNVNFNPIGIFQPQVFPLVADPHDVLKVQGNVNLNSARLSVQPLFLPSVTPPTPITIDDSSTGFTKTGFNNTTFGSQFLNNAAHSAVSSAGVSLQATWTIPNLPPGSYRVSTTAGTANSFRATNVQFTIFNGATAVTTVNVNQRTPRTDITKFGIGWTNLGIVQVTGGSISVQLKNDTDGPIFADAIMIEPHQDVIIDNDGTDPVSGAFANLPEGATVSAIATGFINGQIVQQNQLYTISYRANDGNDVALAYVTTATAAQDLQISPASINEGQKATLTGHLTDPDVGDFLTLTIDWSDGSQTETHHPGTKDFHFSHRYANNPPGQPHGAYTVHLHWFDQNGAGNSRDLSVVVNNVAPGLFLPHQFEVSSHGLLVLPGFFTDPGVQDHWIATVDYGDGTGPQTLIFDSHRHFVLRHRYERSGVYHLTLTIQDSDGDSDTATVLVYVKKKEGGGS